MISYSNLGQGIREFYIHGSVHRDSMLIRSNEMEQYAGVYLLQNYSTCFGRLSRPSSGVRQTVTAASGTGHSVRATTFRQRCLIMCDSAFRVQFSDPYKNVGRTATVLIRVVLGV